MVLAPTPRQPLPNADLVDSWEGPRLAEEVEEEEEEEEGAAADHFTWADRGRLFLLRRIWWHRVCISRFKSSSFPLSNPPIVRTYVSPSNLGPGKEKRD